MSNEISSFRGEYAFLSNFYPAPFNFLEYKLPTVEHGFQALKCDNQKDADYVLSSSTPMEAKLRGRGAIGLRQDWDQVKDTVMYQLVQAKFTQNPALAERLVATGDAQLVEGNTWDDTYWGVYAGHGLNRLGYILMDIRGRLGKVALFL